MSVQKINKKAYCKLAVFSNNDVNKTLQEKITEALLQLNKVGNRKEVQGESHTYVRTIIYHRTIGEILFGILASYERGTFQLTVSDDDDDAETLTVEQVAPPQSDTDSRREFLEGTCYFCILRNHVILISSRSLGVRAIEHHFNWLIREGGIDKKNQVMLSDQVTEATKENIRKMHVKEVEIGMPLVDPSQLTLPMKEDKISGLAVNILSQMPDLKDFFNRDRLTDVIDGNIKIGLKVRYERSTNQKAQRILDEIALAIRNLDEDDITLTLNSGGVVKGHELKLFHMMHIESRNGIPNPDHIFSEMRDWLWNLFKNRTIEP